MSTLTDYKITFGIKKIHDRDFKFIRSISFSLDSVIAEFRNIIHCNSLLEAISLKMDPSSQGEILYTTQGLQLIKITHATTKYDSNPNITADFTLPTTDFMVIVKAWKNFISNGGALLT